jgi:hypothetical protein
MSSTHAFRVGQAEAVQEIFNLGHYLQLLYVCSPVSNSETQLVSVRLFTLPERRDLMGAFMQISKSGLKGMSL